jgi:iron complex outermembrane recepter protein
VLKTASESTAVIANGADEDVLGLEADVGWQAMPWWQCRAGGTWMKREFRYRSDRALRLPGFEGEDPDAQYSLRSSVDLPWRLNASVWVRYVSELSPPVVPYYAAVGLGVGWAWRNVEVSLSGQDLSERHHAEFREGSQPPREIPRSFSARIGARF